MRHGIKGQRHENQHMQTCRARLCRETRLLAAIIQEMKGRSIGRMRRGERNARQRPKTPAGFREYASKGAGWRERFELQPRAGSRIALDLRRRPLQLAAKQKRLQRTVGAALQPKRLLFPEARIQASVAETF